MAVHHSCGECIPATRDTLQRGMIAGVPGAACSLVTAQLRVLDLAVVADIQPLKPATSAGRVTARLSMASKPCDHRKCWQGAAALVSLASPADICNHS